MIISNDDYRKLAESIDIGICWAWLKSVNSHGYAQVQIRGIKYEVHGLIYRYFNGEIENGLELDHTCRNRACVNPDHLEPVTRRVNLLRGDTIPAKNVKKTHCPQGHEYDGIDNRGARFCRVCSREGNNRAYIKRKVHSNAR